MASNAKSFFVLSLFFIMEYLLQSLTSPLFLHDKVHKHSPSSKLPKFHPVAALEQRPNDIKILVIDVEGALLRSSSLFPYFMAVAFEGGGLMRALFLLFLYPFISLLSKSMALKAMVMVSFCGLKEDGFRLGRSVLHKLFLEDVSLEGFEALTKGERRVAVSGLPRVMVEGFLKEYLEVGVVLGRELKVVGGYYVGVMEEEDEKRACDDLEKAFGGEVGTGDVVGIRSLDNGAVHNQVFSQCKEIQTMTEADRRNCHPLPRHKYPKPLIFHDSRLAFKPNPLTMMVVFIWFPFGFILAIFRAFVGILLPYKITLPILSFSGMKLRLKTNTNSSNSSCPSHTKGVSKGCLYVSNHRTLLDPVYLSTCLNRSVTAVTYSLSGISEIVSPIKTVRLSRNREVDRKIMEDQLSQGDLFVCPEGTTCREAYLLRYSKLFGEMDCDIELAAMDTHVDFFYGTTATGLKWLDPLFFLMNPWPSYYIDLLGRLGKECGSSEGSLNPRSDLAMLVQREIGRALGFECTGFTRKDKYLMLAGNEGLVSADNRHKQGEKMPQN